MKVDAIKMQNNNPNFGHSFRVNICLENPTGLGDIFVSPSSNKSLYKTLNSKIVGWLNNDYYDYLRKIFGIPRKADKTEPMNDIARKMVNELYQIDSDYNFFKLVRSVYNGGRLGYIVSGPDVPITEIVKGLKLIGPAKADPFWTNSKTRDSYLQNIISAINGNVLDFIKTDKVLLRSKSDREIMLRAVFKEDGKNSKGTPKYILSRYEFHENKTTPMLKPRNADYENYKRSPKMEDYIKETVYGHVRKISGNRADTCGKNINIAFVQ